MLSKKILVIKSLVKKMLVNNSFGLKKVLGPKNLWLKTILVKKRNRKTPSKKILISNNFGLKIFLSQKIFVQKIMAINIFV